MATQQPPGFLLSASHSAELLRRLMQSYLPFGSCGGVVPATPLSNSMLTSDLKVGPPGSGMSVLVQPGQCWVPGGYGSGSGYGMQAGYGSPVVTLNGGSIPTIPTNGPSTQVQLTTQGIYYCYSDDSAGPVSLAIAAASGSNPRIDVVGAQVEDSQYSGSNNDWKLTVITGSAAASPVIPTLPVSFLPLALVWVPTGSSSVISANILDLRTSVNSNPFFGSVTNAGTTTLTNNAVTAVKWSTLVYDPSASMNPTAGSYTCQVSGLAVVNAKLQTNITTGESRLSLYQNGAEVKRGPLLEATALPSDCVVDAQIQVNAGDVLTIYAFQLSGASSTAGTSGPSNYFDVTILSPL